MTLQVSSGVGEVEHPRPREQLTADAITLLQQLGFEVETEPESSDDIEAGRVIRTDPAAGESAPRGSIVVIVESSGREQVPVPDVVGLQSEEGQAALTAAGFLPDEASESSDTVESGRVIRTEPPAPQPAPRGSRVRMIVSSGTRTVAVPEVRGQPLNAAREHTHGRRPDLDGDRTRLDARERGARARAVGGSGHAGRARDQHRVDGWRQQHADDDGRARRRHQPRDVCARALVRARWAPRTAVADDA